MTVRFQRIRQEATVPAYARDGDAGMDLRSAVSLVVPRGARALVATGLKMALPSGYEGQVRPRSGLALKAGITVLNSPGTIDAGYRGEVGVILANFGESDFLVNVGDRIAQLVIAPVLRVETCEAEISDDTERGTGGFGSTGVGV